MELTWLDILLVIILIASFARGAMTGFIMQVASLAGIVLGAIFCGQVADFIYPHLLGLVGNSEHITGPISYILGFILILVAVNLIGRLINSMVTITLLTIPNRVAGAFFCAIKWVLITSILVNLVTQFDSNKTIINKEVRETSHTYPILTQLAQTIIPYLRFENFDKTIITPPKTDNPQPPGVSV